MRRESPAASWNRIVVGLVPDDSARAPLQRAVSLARSVGAGVRAVHALEIPSLWGGISEAELAERHPEFVEAARQRLEELVAEVAETAGVAVQLDVVPGHPVPVLLDTAAATGANLLMLGPHQRRGIFDFGSTARAVLSRSTLPVWTQAPPVEEIRRILVPVDFSESSESAVDFALDLARRLEARVSFLHAYTPPVLAYAGEVGSAVPSYVVDEERRCADEALTRFVEERDWGEVEVGRIFRTGEAVEEIAAEARRHDLVVLGTHGRTGLSRFVLGSVSYGTLRRSSKPVVVTPARHGDWLLA